MIPKRRMSRLGQDDIACEYLETKYQEIEDQIPNFMGFKIGLFLIYG